MVRAYWLAAGLAVGFLGVAVPRTEAQPPPAPPPEVKIGFPAALFRDVPQSLIKTAAAPFQSMIQKTAGLNGTLEIVEDYRVLADRLKNKKMDIGVFHGFEYAWVKHDPDLVPIVVTVPNCGKVQACLVVSENSKAKSPRDLKGDCVGIPRGSKAHCQMFLEWLRENEKIPANRCCPSKITGLTPEEVLDDVLTGKCEAALVDVSALLSYQNNKPGLAAGLKVLAESELLPSAVVVYRKGTLTAADVDAVRSGLMKCNKTAQGRTFILFWNLKGFAEAGTEYAAALERCLKTYPAPTDPK